MAEAKSFERIREESPKSIDEFIEWIQSSESKSLDSSKIKEAYCFAEKAHSGQVRRSGDPYITHPLGVAAILYDLGLDEASIITGLLHDTVEDTDVSLNEIESLFGEDVMHLVDGVTKISQMSFRNTHQKQGENIRKMIVAMGKDIRVVMVKLADRLHNMRTLNHMPPHKQEKIAQETLDIYAPLANRLGISSIKVELEDLSFRYLRPDLFYNLVNMVDKKKKERLKYVEDVKSAIQEMMQKSGLEVDVQGRSKHLYSIYKKMDRKNLEFDQIFDLLGVRILVESVAQCYQALGIIHSKWKPVPGRFKDYIALAKSNNYQSLHTTVIGLNGEHIEVQIRTQEMHLIAERGIAAHWKYKEGKKVSVESEEKFRWLREMTSNLQTEMDAGEYLENIKTDLFDSEIYVFTPAGDVKELPEGATPLDFAYSIHTDVGNHCVGAKVNGKIVPLKHRLSSGDSIEIMTSSNQNPSKDWLKFTVTSRAQSKIRWYVKNEERKRALELGKDIAEKELRKFGHSVRKIFQGPDFEEYIRKYGCKSIDEYYTAIGYGKFNIPDLLEALFPDEKSEKTPVEQEEGFLDKVFKSANKKKKKDSLITVDGMSDVLVRYAKCCSPIPGDPIVGFISRGRGVTVHKASCPKVFEIDSSRQLEVEWGGKTQSMSNVQIRIVSQDLLGLLGKVSEAFTLSNANILNAKVRTTKDQKAIYIFDIQVRDTKHLNQVITNIQRIHGVIGVDRT